MLTHSLPRVLVLVRLLLDGWGVLRIIIIIITGERIRLEKKGIVVPYLLEPMPPIPHGGRSTTTTNAGVRRRQCDRGGHLTKGRQGRSEAEDEVQWVAIRQCVVANFCGALRNTLIGWVVLLLLVTVSGQPLCTGSSFISKRCDYPVRKRADVERNKERSK